MIIVLLIKIFKKKKKFAWIFSDTVKKDFFENNLNFISDENIKYENNTKFISDEN